MIFRLSYLSFFLWVKQKNIYFSKIRQELTREFVIIHHQEMEVKYDNQNKRKIFS